MLVYLTDRVGLKMLMRLDMGNEFAPSQSDSVIVFRFSKVAGKFQPRDNFVANLTQCREINVLLNRVFPIEFNEPLQHIGNDAMRYNFGRLKFRQWSGVREKVFKLSKVFFLFFFFILVFVFFFKGIGTLLIPYQYPFVQTVFFQFLNNGAVRAARLSKGAVLKIAETG